MIDCYQVSNMLFIFFGSILIGSILQLLMMALPGKTSRREKNYEKVLRELEALEKLQKATDRDND